VRDQRKVIGKTGIRWGDFEAERKATHYWRQGRVFQHRQRRLFRQKGGQMQVAQMS
jgi:hypothetical protein